MAVTHPYVPPPPVNGPEDRLWVSLQAHLGRPDQSGPLTLHGAGSPLSLSDASGRDWSGSVLTITWRRVPRETPLMLSRRVAGPFASFESAERVAKRWREIGVAAVVAHPDDWEVWAPKGAPLPDGLAVRDWHGSIDSVVLPVLQLSLIHI